MLPVSSCAVSEPLTTTQPFPFLVTCICRPILEPACFKARHIPLLLNVSWNHGGRGGK